MNTEWLNETPNKTPRTEGTAPLAIVYHETASSNPNASATLNWNLRPDAASSYTALIGRDGELYAYVDPDAFVAWHAGRYDDAHDAMIELYGRTYRGFEVNVVTLGIEVDGPADGTPATPAQISTLVAWISAMTAKYRIPLDRRYHKAHRELTSPTYRTDPRGYSVDAILSMVIAQQQAWLPPGAALRGKIAGLANERSGPSTTMPVVGKRQAGEIVPLRTRLRGDPVGADPWWWETDRGWIHSSLISVGG